MIRTILGESFQEIDSQKDVVTSIWWCLKDYRGKREDLMILSAIVIDTDKLSEDSFRYLPYLARGYQDLDRPLKVFPILSWITGL